MRARLRLRAQPSDPPRSEPRGDDRPSSARLPGGRSRGSSVATGAIDHLHQAAQNADRKQRGSIAPTNRGRSACGNGCAQRRSDAATAPEKENLQHDKRR